MVRATCALLEHRERLAHQVIRGAGRVDVLRAEVELHREGSGRRRMALKTTEVIRSRNVLLAAELAADDDAIGCTATCSRCFWTPTGNTAFPWLWI